MRKPVVTAGTLVLALCAVCAPAAAWKTVCAPGIPAVMVDSVNSGSAYPGMRFRFKTMAAATFAGRVIPRGSTGYGYVREVTSASNRNRNGSLMLDMREIRMAAGAPVQVIGDPLETALWAPATTIAERASGFVPIAGLVRSAVNEVRSGRNVTVGPGFAFHVIPLGDPRTTQLCRKE